MQFLTGWHCSVQLSIFSFNITSLSLSLVVAVQMVLSGMRRGSKLANRLPNDSSSFFFCVFSFIICGLVSTEVECQADKSSLSPSILNNERMATLQANRLSNSKLFAELKRILFIYSKSHIHSFCLTLKTHYFTSMHMARGDILGFIELHSGWRCTYISGVFT